MTELIKDPVQIRRTVRSHRCSNQEVGFVPTMGAFHPGHRRLMEESVGDNDVTVVSLFVNPTQFDSSEDAEAYPRDHDRDREIARTESVDYLFMPEREDMYPPGDSTRIRVDLPLTRRYEGQHRPRFFEGMVRVVSKLLNLIPAQRLYMGEKDLQQLVVVRRLIRDLHFSHCLVPVPVERDQYGVAYSSRNRGFSETQRDAARRVAGLMKELRDEIRRQEEVEPLERYQSKIEQAGIDLDYLDLVSYPEFESTGGDDRSSVLVLGGRIGDIRLKDNRPVYHSSVRELDSLSV